MEGESTPKKNTKQKMTPTKESANHATPVKKARSARYNSEELEALVTNVETNSYMLFSAFQGTTITHEKKEEAWRDICSKVNAKNSKCTRDVAQVKAKWSDFASRSKIKKAKLLKERRMTGNNKIDKELELSEMEQKAIVIIGGDAAVSGIEGGIDTLDTQETDGDQSHTDASMNIENEANDDANEEPGSSTQTTHDEDAATMTGNDPPREAGVNHFNRKDDVPNLFSKKKKSDVSERVVDIEYRKLKIMEQELDISKQRLEVEKAIDSKLDLIWRALDRNTASALGPSSSANPYFNFPLMPSTQSDSAAFVTGGSKVYTQM